MNKYDVVKSLNKEIDNIEKTIQRNKLLNIRNKVIRGLIKSGIKIEHALPYIISSIIIINTNIYKDNKPFIMDTYNSYVNKELITTSSNNTIENTSIDIPIKDDKYEYSTGWKKNNNNLFEREITSYQIKNEYNINDFDSFLELSLNDINNMFEIIDKQTIEKEVLDSEDLLYDEDMLIITHYEKTDEYITKKETIAENIFHSIGFAGITFLGGLGTKKVKKIFIKRKKNHYLNNMLDEYQEISPEVIENLKNILAIKKNNLDYLLDDEKIKRKRIG